MNAVQARPGKKMWTGTFRVLLAESLILPTGLLTAAYLTRTLGPGLYGLLTLVSVLICWVEWGITSVFSRTTIKLAAQQEDWRPVGTFALRLHLGVSLACTLGIWWLAPSLAEWLHEPRLEYFLRLLSLDIPLFCLASTHRDILVGMGAFRERAIGSAWRWTTKLIIVVALVELGLSVEGALIGAIGSSAIELLVCRYYVRPSLFGKTDVSLRKAMDYALPLFLFALAMQLYDRLDLLILKLLGGSNEMAGFFGAAQNLSIVPGLFAMSFSPLLLSTLGRLKRSGDDSGARRILRNALRLTVLLLPFAALAAGCAVELVTLLFGSEFSQVGPIFSILVFGAGGLVIISVTTASLTAAGRPGLTFLLTGPMVPLAIVAHLLVIPVWGPTGAATVTTLGTFAGALVTVLAVHRIWHVLPPLSSAVRSLVLSALVYAVATFVPTEGVLVIPKLLLLASLIPLAYWLLREFQPFELQQLRELARSRMARGLRGQPPPSPLPPNSVSDSPTTESLDFGVDTFGDFAPEYDQFRPRYPDALWEKLLEEMSAPVVADLGCGTGIAAVELARRGARVTGVEPDPGMREEARQSALRAGVELEVVAGDGEVTSLADASRDLVTSAQSFHWFATQTALSEISRILRPNGRFAMWWNERNVVGVPYMDAFECMIKRYNPSYRREYRTRNWTQIMSRLHLPKALGPPLESLEEGLKRYNPLYRDRFSLHDWRPLLRQSGQFQSVELHTFENSMPSNVEHFCNYAFTLPFVRNEIDEARHAAFRSELESMLRDHHGESSFQVEFTTWLYLSRK